MRKLLRMWNVGKKVWINDFFYGNKDNVYVQTKGKWNQINKVEIYDSNNNINTQKDAFLVNKRKGWKWVTLYLKEKSKNGFHQNNFKV